MISDLGYSVVKKVHSFNGKELQEISKKMGGIELPIKVDEEAIVKVEDGEAFEFLPKEFKSYDEMLKTMAEQEYGEQIKLIKKLCLQYSKYGVPKYPSLEDIQVKPGWSKYDFNGNYVEAVESPSERILVFDTETFVQGGNFPIIGTATGAKNSYIWIAREFIENIEAEDYDQYGFVPLNGTDVIIGHNVGFDLCRVREAYELPTKITALDTLSMHVATNGLCSAQRYVASLKYKEKEKLTEREKAILRNPPKWAEAGTTNSLVAVYNFHVARGDFFEEVEKITEADKEIRNVFVDTPSMKDFQNMGLFQKDLLFYAAKDTYYTAKIFEKLFPKYVDTKPHIAALAGHLEIMSARVPVASDWIEWTERVETLLEKDQQFVSDIIKEQADFLYECWADGDLKLLDIAKDPWLNQLDWSPKRKKIGGNFKPNALNLKLKAMYEAETFEELPQLKEIFGNESLDLKKLKKYLAEHSKYVYVPAWYLQVIGKADGKISTKSDLSHLLLRLEWKGKPVHKHKTMGWGTFDESGKFEKVPHKESIGENVGDLLAKSFLDDMKNGNLSGKHLKVGEIFDVAIRISFWVSTRNRVMERFVKRSKIGTSEGLLMCPQTIVHGTTTGRATENLLLVMSNIKPEKIGSELRSKIEAPKGYKIVG